MLLDAVRQIDTTQADPDPAALDIPSDLVFHNRARQLQSSVPNTKVVLALEAPASESVTVDLYAVQEDSVSSTSFDGGPIPRGRLFLLEAGVVVPGSQLVSRDCHMGGWIYTRVRSNTLSVARSLRSACVPGSGKPSAGSVTTDDVTNVSSVSGGTATAAFNSLFSITQAPVANIAALSATANSVEGIAHYVLTVRDTWVSSNRASPATVDVITVATHANGGNWRWERLCIPHPSWKLQPTWYVDPVAGADEASGSVGGPLKTSYELWRRGVTCGAVSVTTTINIVSSLPGSESFNLDVTVPATIGYVVQGVPSVAYTGTVTAKTDLSTTGGAGNGLLPTVTASWTPATHVGRIVKDVTNNRYSCVLEDVSGTAIPGGGTYPANTAKLAPWLAINETGGGDNSTITEGNTTVSATIEVYTLPAVDDHVFTLQGGTTLGGANAIVIQKLNFVSTHSNHVTAVNTQIAWQNCLESSGTRFGAGSHQVNNCYGGFGASTRDYSAFVAFNGGCQTGAWLNNASPGGTTIELCHNVVFKGVQCLLNRGGFLRIRAVFFEGLGATACLNLLESSQAKLSSSTVCGNGNTGLALQLQGGCKAWWSAGTAVAQWKLACAALPINSNGNTSCRAWDETAGAYTSSRSLTFANLDQSVAAGGFGGLVSDPRCGVSIGVTI